MRHWSLLGIRNLRVKPGRSAGAVLAVALGVAIVVWITSAYESFMASVTDQVQAWVGHSQISIESSFLGVVDESLVAEVRELQNIRLVCPKAKFHCRWIQPNDLAGETAPQDNLGSVDVVGIVPEVEYEFRTFRGLDQPLSDRSQPTYGRLLLPGERDKCMIEDALAAEHGLTIGDVIGVTSEPGGPVRRFEIVGRYVVRRVAQFQRPSLVVLLPELQSLRKMTGQVSVIDIILEDDSLEALRATTADIEKLIVDAGLNYPVSTAEARMRQLKEAQEFTEFLLGLLSAVALLTAIFVIVTTLSMGMIERLTQLGMMRCIGFSRLQLGVVTLCEIVPIGIAGVLAGVPLGIALTWLSVQTVPEYLQSMVISQWGIRTGVIGGLVTSILSGLIPAAQAMRVSPLAATRPRTNRRGPALVIAAALGGVLLLAGHEVGLKLVPGHLWFHKAVYSTATLTAYAGFALLTPAAVYFLSGFLAAIVARVLRIRRQLLHDQVAGTPWRSGTICTGFMVALSLGVCISVHVDSLLAGWDFPS
ncbi:MAG: ABC transporter permease, partial [Planctomycetes bacterium]|nr:ABC transporter permease [Planctomycetota bacterium]